MDELILRALLELISCVIERPDFLSRERVTSLELVQADLLGRLRGITPPTVEMDRRGAIGSSAVSISLTASTLENVEDFVQFLRTYKPK